MNVFSFFFWMDREGGKSLRFLFLTNCVMREMEGVRCDELSVQGFMGIKAIR